MADVAQVSYLISYHLRSLSSSNALLLDDDVFLLMLKNIDRYWLFWGGRYLLTILRFGVGKIPFVARFLGEALLLWA